MVIAERDGEIPENRDPRHSWRTGLIGLITTVACLCCTAQTLVGSARPQPLLTPLATLTGGWVSQQPRSAPSAQSPLPMAAGFFSWQLPVAISVRGNMVYVVDGGRRQIYRYDQMQQSVAAFSNHSAVAGTAIAVAPDLSLYVTDTIKRQVLHFSFDGQLLQRFGSDMEMAHPVALVVDESGGTVWVADGLYNQVLVFGNLGRLLTVLKSHQALSIAALALGPDGLYLLDSVGRQVVVLGRDGMDRYTVGNGALNMPSAIAVDRFNRIFVSDSFDNSIKIFDQRKLVASVGVSGTTPASFNRITDLRLDQNTLYVADSVNRRVQTFRVEPLLRAGLTSDHAQ